MPDTEYFRWYVPHDYGPKKGKLHLSSWRMTAEDARQRYGPDVQPDLSSREVRSGGLTLPHSTGVDAAAESLRLLREWKPKE